MSCKMYKYEARIAELERLLGQAHAENELLKKPSPYLKMPSETYGI